MNINGQTGQAIHRIRCGEIWGGNRGDQLELVTSSLRASLFSRSCDGGKGGDLYYLSVCESDLLTRIAIVDVVGHGESVSTTSDRLYESLARQMNSSDGSVVLADLNRLSNELGQKAMATAAVSAFYHADSRFYVAYAGHNELLLKRSTETTWKLISPTESDDIAGLPLGVLEECDYVQQSLPGAVGDRLFLYTDGLVEAMDSSGEQFGIQRLLNVLNGTGTESVSTVRMAVLDAIMTHSGGSLGHDDVTFLVVEIAEQDTTEK